MSDAGWVALLRDAQETVERLTRERDEARMNAHEQAHAWEQAERERDGWRGSYMEATGTISRLAAALRAVEKCCGSMLCDVCDEAARAALAEVGP
jgi:hypothetical protein